MTSSETRSNKKRMYRISHYSLRRRERKSLRELLSKDERVKAISRGSYIGGRGLLIATSRRLILLDTKMLSSYTKTLRYERVQAVKHSKKLFESFIFLTVDSKKFVFRSRSKDALRKVAAQIHYSITPKMAGSTDYEALLKQPESTLKSQPLVPRHRHGKFSVLPQ